MAVVRRLVSQCIPSAFVKYLARPVALSASNNFLAVTF